MVCAIILSVLIGVVIGYLAGFYFAPTKIEEVEVPVEKIVEKVVYVDRPETESMNKPSNKKKKKVVSPEVTA